MQLLDPPCSPRGRDASIHSLAQEAADDREADRPQRGAGVRSSLTGTFSAFSSAAFFTSPFIIPGFFIPPAIGSSIFIFFLTFGFAFGAGAAFAGLSSS